MTSLGTGRATRVPQAQPDRRTEPRPRRPGPARVQRTIGLILRVGVLMAAALMAIGLTATAAAGRRPAGTVAGPSSSVAHILSGLPSLRPESITAAGILVLVATPVAQLLASAFLFWRERDRAYTGVTLLVLVVVAVGALVARGAG